MLIAIELEVLRVYRIWRHALWTVQQDVSLFNSTWQRRNFIKYLTPFALAPHKSHAFYSWRHISNMKSIPFKNCPSGRHAGKTSLYQNVAFHIDRSYCVSQSRAVESLFYFHPGHYGWRSIRGRLPGRSRDEDEKCGARGKLKQRNFRNKMIRRQVRTRGCYSKVS
jgi:hypothetical protein